MSTASCVVSRLLEFGEGLDCVYFFFFQAEDGIRDLTVTGVQTCALPIYNGHIYSEAGQVRKPGGQDGRAQCQTRSKYDRYAGLVACVFGRSRESCPQGGADRKSVV